MSSPTIVRKNETELPVPVSQVWSALADFQNLPTWNPVVSIRGAAALDSRIWLTLRLARLPPVMLPARLVVFDPPYALHWKSGVAGVFQGEHFFHLESLASGTTRLTHGEIFTGRLARPVLRLGLDRLSMAAYRRIDAALIEHLTNSPD